jgi:hypothetical protein
MAFVAIKMGRRVRQLPMRVNISGRGAPDREGARPRATRRRSQSRGCIFVLDQGMLWTAEATDREDAIPPGVARHLPDESHVIYGTGH